MLKTSHLSNPFINMTFGISAALFVAGCESDSRAQSKSASQPTTSALVTKSASPSPVPNGQTLCGYIDDITDDLHSESRGTNFIRSYKEGFMTKDQYTSNMVQRYKILKTLLDEAHKDPRMEALYGQESLDLLSHYEKDLEKLGKPVSSITDKDIIAPTRDCLKYISTLSPEAMLMGSHMQVGGASNGGKYIGKGIQKQLGEETPVSGFTGSPHEAIEKLEARVNQISTDHHAEIAAAAVKFYQLFIKINNDPIYGDPAKGKSDKNPTTQP